MFIDTLFYFNVNFYKYRMRMSFNKRGKMWKTIPSDRCFYCGCIRDLYLEYTYKRSKVNIFNFYFFFVSKLYETREYICIPFENIAWAPKNIIDKKNLQVHKSLNHILFLHSTTLNNSRSTWYSWHWNICISVYL